MILKRRNLKVLGMYLSFSWRKVCWLNVRTSSLTSASLIQTVLPITCIITSRVTTHGSPATRRVPASRLRTSVRSFASAAPSVRTHIPVSCFLRSPSSRDANSALVFPHLQVRTVSQVADAKLSATPSSVPATWQ